MVHGGLDLFDLFDLFDEFKAFLGHQTQVRFLLEGDLVPKLEPRMLDICTSQPSPAANPPRTRCAFFRTRPQSAAKLVLGQPVAGCKSRCKSVVYRF